MFHGLSHRNKFDYFGSPTTTTATTAVCDIQLFFNFCNAYYYMAQSQLFTCIYFDNHFVLDIHLPCMHSQASHMCAYVITCITFIHRSCPTILLFLHAVLYLPGRFGNDSWLYIWCSSCNLTILSTFLKQKSRKCLAVKIVITKVISCIIFKDIILQDIIK